MMIYYWSAWFVVLFEVLKCYKMEAQWRHPAVAREHPPRPIKDGSTGYGYSNLMQDESEWILTGFTITERRYGDEPVILR